MGGNDVCFSYRENENPRVSDTLVIMKEMNERAEMLSRQILLSVGTEEAKLTAELYDTMLSYDAVRILSYMSHRPTPQAILENDDINSCAAALGLKFKIKRTKAYSYGGDETISNMQHESISKRYLELRSKLVEILQKHGLTPEQYISSLRKSEHPD